MTPGPLDVPLLQNLATALFIGALVGVDRERRAAGGTPTFGGFRTFMLIALGGATATWLSGALGLPWLVQTGLLGLCGMLAVSYHTAAGSGPPPGLTSEIAAVIVYLLGAACTGGYAEMAVVIAIATSGLLAFKAPLHAMAAQIGPDDLSAGLKLLFATFIVLPLLPDTPVDPWGALVPYRLWWLVVLISGLSLLGYAAVRILGERRGLALTGLFGGLVSSTAVTLSAARESKALPLGASAFAMSAMLAWTVMFVRVLVEVAFVNPRLLGGLSWPIGAMAVTAGLAALWLGTRPRGAAEAGEITLRNPFSLWEAIKFAALFAGVLVVVELARRSLDARALYAIAALAGTTDVDAITLSLAELAGRELDDRVAIDAILIAAVSNTLVKAGMVAALGSREMSARLLPAAGLLAVVGVGAALLT